MPEKMLKIKYQCLHPSCQVYCGKGELTLEKSQFEELLTAFDEKQKFKSPRGVCRLGFSQPFKALSTVEKSTEGAEASMEAPGDKVGSDPLEVLKEEHKEGLKKLDFIEEQIRRRDITRLWESTADVENFIILHAIKTEEEVLFPIVLKKAPEELTFIQIVYEDHKEMVNLRNHFLKEDEEFFSRMDEHLTAEDRTNILEQMEKIQKEFVPAEAGDRREKIKSPYLENRKRLDSEIAHAKHESIKDDWSCH
jgi:hypothetical protein